MLRVLAVVAVAAAVAGCFHDDISFAGGARPFVRATFWNNATAAVEFELRAGDVQIGPTTVGPGDRASAAADYQDARLAYRATAGGKTREGEIVASSDVVHLTLAWRGGELRVAAHGAAVE